MTPPIPRFFFDYVDPISYLVELELQAVEKASGQLVERVALELRAPPEAMVDPRSSPWIQQWEDAARTASELGIPLHRASLVPWTRKAHELVMHARAHELGRAVHTALFEGVFVEGLDIGRVDVLVRLAVGLGLDATETKAVLDVDRYSNDIAAARATILAEGITRTPTLVAGERRLEGFHNHTALGTFVRASGTPDITLD